MPDVIEQLEPLYRELAEAHGSAIMRGDYKQANKAHDKLISLVPEFRSCGGAGEDALIRLMNDKSEWVACWAATHCLPFSEADALKLLDVLASRPGVAGFNAGMVAQQWRRERPSIL